MMTLQARIIKEGLDTFTLVKKFKNMDTMRAYIEELFKTYGHFGRRYYSLGLDKNDYDKYLADIRIIEKKDVT